MVHYNIFPDYYAFKNHFLQVMRRGNDLLRALDAIQFYKGQEYDKLRNELLWQKRRFSRVSVT